MLKVVYRHQMPKYHQQFLLYINDQKLAFIKAVVLRGCLPSFQRIEYLMESYFEPYMTLPINVIKQGMIIKIFLSG